MPIGYNLGSFFINIDGVYFRLEIQANAIAEHIDYVVGMNSTIGDDAAIKLAIGLYDELGAGYTISLKS